MRSIFRSSGRKYRDHYGYEPSEISSAAVDAINAKLTAHQIRRADRYVRACEKTGADPKDGPNHIREKLRVMSRARRQK